MWIANLRNENAISGLFGAAVPDLRDLVFEQLVLNAPGEVALAFAFGKLPDVVPTRWRQKGYDSLQVRLRLIGVDELCFKLPTETLRSKLALEFSVKELKIQFQDSATQLSIRFYEAIMDFYPFRAADFEFSPRWYCQQ
jgi:hypothetical protein